ncbi:glutathione S-transferase N-terminal domain-containing protein [Cystobacter fuscus]
MPQLILHHYPSSPFSEKIRAILGFKGLRWSSVVIPVIMPKPDVVALTGGYRKTPFLQIGSDIYCDSALIADVLERLAPTPSLHPPESAGRRASWRSGRTPRCSAPPWATSSSPRACRASSATCLRSTSRPSWPIAPP